MREDRFLLGASADVPDVWSHAVLRQLAESARQQTRTRQWTSRDCIGTAGRALVVLLPRRGFHRILSADCVLSDSAAVQALVIDP
jgi:hypothetical protein